MVVPMDLPKDVKKFQKVVISFHVLRVAERDSKKALGCRKQLDSVFLKILRNSAKGLGQVY